MKKFLSRKTKNAILSAVSFGICFGSFNAASAADVPSFFDWRLTTPTDSTSAKDSLSIVSPVENQNYGTCWTFGTFGSYESSWLKQLKEAQAAGFNVTPTRNIFSKYYLAWTAMMQPADDADDTSIRELTHGDITIYKDENNHPIYDQGGGIDETVLALVKYGAIDASAITMAKTAEEKEYVSAELYTSAVWNRVIGIAEKSLSEDIYAMQLLKEDADALYTLKRNSDEFTKLAQDTYKAMIPDAVLETVEPKGLLHDTYNVKNAELENKVNGLSEQQLAAVKELIQTEGVVYVAHKAGEELVYFYQGELNPFNTQSTHAESLVGWDDNYTFKNYTNKDGTPLQGAFIIRNSWGETYKFKNGVTIPMANDGYAYLSYRDASIGNVSFFNAELDSKRYTINQMNTPALDAIDFLDDNEKLGTQAIANYYTAKTEGGQFLKAVMLYASEANMPYEITVREGSTPGEGTILTQQSGTFGADGNAKWGGYRTVDLDNFVFLPNGKKYTVEVRTTSPTGKTVYVALMAGQEVNYDDSESFMYSEPDKAWYSTEAVEFIDDQNKTAASSVLKADSDDDDELFDMPTGYNDETLDRKDYKHVHVFAVARNKESSAANGADFKVSWLDDTDSTGNSVINLGSATELYTSDNTNPDRVTLSNMTVDLGADVYNLYRGSISGEGSVTKTGAGVLDLSGTNTYTGGTFVDNGRLEINGTISGDATTTDSGTISGSGTIGGTLYNYSRAVAGNLAGEGDLTVQNLESSGELVAQKNSKFVVKGAANVDGSTVTAENVTAINETATVLTANSISGKLANSADNPNELAPLLSAYGEIAGNKINYTVATTNNLGALSEDENLGFNAVKNMSNSAEVLPVYNLDSANAKYTLAQIGNSDSVQLLSAAQQSTVANRVISDRLATAFTANTINFNVGGNNFADGDDTILMGVSANYDTPADNNFWVKFTKNWGELKGGADYHGSAISGGYDRALSENWRGGIFISYNATNLSSNNSGGNAYDTRGGFYFGYANDVDNSFFYIDAGKVRNKLNRSIGALGLSTEAKYNSNIFEIGGEYKRNMTPEKSFAVSPFINLQFSHLKQNDYSETGAGVFNQHVQSNSNNYFAGQLGVEYKKILSHGNYAARIGIKHAFTGADPELNFSYEGDANNFYTLKNNQDKTHFVLSIGGENNFKGGWILGGDVGWQKGAHDKDITASVLLRKIW